MNRYRNALNQFNANLLKNWFQLNTVHMKMKAWFEIRLSLFCRFLYLQWHPLPGGQDVRGWMWQDLYLWERHVGSCDLQGQVSYVFTYESWIKILLCHLPCLSFSLFSPSYISAVYTKVDLETLLAFLCVFIFSAVISQVKSLNLDLSMENKHIKNASLFSL